MRPFFLIHDIIEENGKTVRENNLAKPHNIPIGALVELVNDEDGVRVGARAFVILHRRDCDGTPLYSLALRKDETDLHRMDHGWPEDALKAV